MIVKLAPRESVVATDRTYANLEILRIAAAALVIFYHLQGRFALELNQMLGLNGALRSLGSIGVDIFFVVSGFVIALNVDRGDGGMRFAWARARRIVPSYWLLTSLAAVFMIFLPGQFSEPFNAGKFLSSLFFADLEAGFTAPLISMGWTLDLEVRFYLIVVLALLCVPKRVPRAIVLGAAFGSLLLFVSIGHQDAIMYEFGFGFAAFALLKYLPRNKLIGAGLLSVGGLGIVAWLLGITDGLERWVCFGLPAFAIVLGMLVLPQARQPFLKRLGFASYSTYLVQWFSIPVFIFAVKALNPSEVFAPFLMVVGLIVCVGAGVAYSMIIDERLYRFVKRIPIGGRTVRPLPESVGTSPRV